MEFVVLALLGMAGLATASLSGLYVDNGMGQTMLHRVMSRQEKRDVENELLHLLGLPKKPRPPSGGGSAPKFMLDVYKSLLEPASSRRMPRSEFNLSGNDLNAIDRSDTIMSFASHAHHGGGLRHERGRRLWFDVSEVAPEDAVVGAELRVFQVANSSAPAVDFTLAAYQLLSDDHGDMEVELIDSVNCSTAQEGWITLNVTGVFSTWVAFPSTNLGLYLAVHSAHRPGHELHVSDVGLVSTKGIKERQPFMVAFFKTNSKAHKRTTREVHARSKKSDTTISENPYLAKSHSTTHWSSESCQLLTLYVNFRDLKWDDWIIAPEGYHAFYCSGECNFPLNAHMNATNHAIVQTLVHLVNPTQVPKPCCAPTKLGHVHVLYYTADANVMLKKYKNMVVKSCGCH